MIEYQFDIPFIADLALREKQIQQNHRPIISVHKWFARRPGTLFRGLLLSEFASSPLRKGFYEPHTYKGLRIADPFMGGGIPLIEANRIGCDIIGFDINPMAHWIVQREIEHIDLDAYRSEAETLRRDLEQDIGPLYRTRCLECGTTHAHVKYFLWVKTITCKECGEDIRLFPGTLVAQNVRHPKNVFVCLKCGNLTETDDRQHPGLCATCGVPLSTQGPAKRNKCACPRCGHVNTYPVPEPGPSRHHMFAIEYHCPNCKSHHRGRFFKTPDTDDLGSIEEAKAYCDHPFEILHRGKGKRTIPMPGEWIGDKDSRGVTQRSIDLSCTDSTLKPGSPLAFTYHHNAISAYYPVAVAILDAGLTCSGSLPCPAEMGASIHINGTGSSIIDTVFVCRSTGKFPREWLTESPEALARLVQDNVDALRKAKVKVTYGDMRCITYGHLIRLSIWALRKTWDPRRQSEERLQAVARWIDNFGGLSAVEEFLNLDSENLFESRRAAVAEPAAVYTEKGEAITF